MITSRDYKLKAPLKKGAFSLLTQN